VSAPTLNLCEPLWTLSPAFPVNFSAHAAHKTLWRIPARNPGRLRRLASHAVARVPDKSVVGETPCPEDDGSAGRHKSPRLCAGHLSRQRTNLRQGTGAR
jgi:hypothetical protein